MSSYVNVIDKMAPPPPWNKLKSYKKWWGITANSSINFMN